MITGSLELRIYAPECHSLKEKRMIVRSLVDGVRAKFNVAIAEVGDQDKHQSIVLGVACVSNSETHARVMLDAVERYIEAHTSAEIVASYVSFA